MRHSGRKNMKEIVNSGHTVIVLMSGISTAWDEQTQPLLDAEKS